MDPQKFRHSTTLAGPPDGLGFALQALWWDGQGRLEQGA
jgi:hypothetical protein